MNEPGVAKRVETSVETRKKEHPVSPNGPRLAFLGGN